MEDSLLKSLACADDKFQFVVEFASLYQSRGCYTRAIEALENLTTTEVTGDDTSNIRLALVFVKRCLSADSPESLLAELDEIATKVTGKTELELKARVVRGSVLLMSVRDYTQSRNILESAYLELKRTPYHFVFGLAARYLGVVYTLIGEHSLADDALQDALSTFRRYGHDISYGFALSEYGVLKKRVGQYADAIRALRQADKTFSRLGIKRGQMAVSSNLGTVYVKTGDWSSAELFYRNAQKARESTVCDEDANSVAAFARACDTHLERLMMLRRDFDGAETALKRLLELYRGQRRTRRIEALVHEFLGELHTESGDYERADYHLGQAYDITEEILPDSDVMTEVRRRLAQLRACQGRFDEAKDEAFKCVRLCKKIGDRNELGAVLRILGEVYAKKAQHKKAVACFETAIMTLKAIQECYELMRGCISYGAYLVERREGDAEVYLMEARQLCKKLELDYFLARINVLLGIHATNQDNFTEARTYLSGAEEIYDKLQACDQRQMKALLDNANRELDERIMRRSITAAEELKTICRVYEEARFPIEELKPDLAYQVAQSVGAECLFLARRKGRGHELPLTYNISAKDARELVRRLDRNLKRPLMGIEKDPQIFEMHDGRSLVCVPGCGEEGYVLCTQMGAGQSITPRQLEFLFASAEAMERLAEGKAEDRPTVDDAFICEGGDKVATHPRGSFRGILTIDPVMIQVIRLAERASATNATILLEGETGVGKELFARAIHVNSPRGKRAFVAINAGGMPVNLIESQLFGHVKGAYTDAVVDRVGLIEEAAGGTVFLDEVGEMGPELQVKLLRLLENGEYRRLGENRVRIADVRVISATNRELLKEVEKGTFRRDLYYRLGTVKLQIPALRLRPCDVELLIRHFLKENALQQDGQSRRHFQIDCKAMEALELYDWPGNVRELQNEITRILSLIGESDVIRFGMLSQSIKDYLKTKGRGEGLLEQSVERYERRLILEALQKHDWNRLRTAEELGVPRTTLLAKMRRLNVAAR